MSSFHKLLKKTEESRAERLKRELGKTKTNNVSQRSKSINIARQGKSPDEDNGMTLLPASRLSMRHGKSLVDENREEVELGRKGNGNERVIESNRTRRIVRTVLKTKNVNAKPITGVKNTSSSNNKKDASNSPSVYENSTPSMHIRSLFQNREGVRGVQPIDSSTKKSATSRSRFQNAATSRSQLQNTIEEAQKRVLKNDTDDKKDGEDKVSKENGETNHLGSNEKERAIRTGDYWTSGYRERRLQRRGRPKKKMGSRLSSSSSNGSVASAPPGSTASTIAMIL